MKDIKSLLLLFIVICISTSVFGQATKESIKMRMWESGDPDFEITEIPEKWKDEPAVILATSTEYEFKKQGMSSKINKDRYYRTRINILDKSALENFSEFAFFDEQKDFSWSRDGNFFGVKIIKPDGTEIEIDVDEAVQMQKFKNSKEKRVIDEGYKKLAIPELEIGDIIDYYYVYINTVSTKYSGKSNRFEFNPVIITLNDDYPIIKGKISFLPERKCFINLSVSNGAPKPVRKTRNNKDVFVIEYCDLEKLKTELWTYPYRQYPTLKFQVIIAPSYISANEKHFLGYPEILKTSVENEEYIRLLNLMTVYMLDHNGMKEAGLKFVTKQRKSENPEMLIEDLFYFFRHYLYFRNHYGLAYPNYYYYDRFDFIEAFSKILTEKEIEHFVFLGVPKFIGTIDSAVILKEVVPGIRVNLENKEVYIFNPDLHSVFGEGKYTLEGTKIIEKKMDHNKKESFSLVFDSIPLSNCSDNYQFDSIYVSFDSIQENLLQLFYHNSTGGSLKDEFRDLVLIPGDYFHDEYKQFNDIKKIKQKDLREKENNLKYINKRFDKDNKFRKDAFNEWTKQRYDISKLEIDTFNILQHGRFNETSDIVFSCEMELPECVKNAGNYLIVDAGKLIGKNIDLNPKEKDRKKDIYMTAPRKYDWVVNIEIPEAYTIENVDNFNYSVENSTGGFVSKASIGDKYVTLKASKYYFHNYEPIEKWPEMLEFLEAANDFVQQKMVFIKDVKDNAMQ